MTTPPFGTSQIPQQAQWAVSILPRQLSSFSIPNYNLIALDARHAGQTTSRLNGKQDSWTDAADLAFALEVRVCFMIPLLACISGPNRGISVMND